MQQHRAGAVGIDRARVEGDAEPARQVGGALADAVDGAPVGAFVAAAPAIARSRMARSLGSSSGRAAQDVTLVEQRCDRAAERARLGDEHRARRGWTGSVSIRRPGAVIATVGVERAQLGEQLVGRHAASCSAAG